MSTYVLVVLVVLDLVVLCAHLTGVASDWCEPFFFWGQRKGPGSRGWTEIKSFQKPERPGFLIA